MWMRVAAAFASGGDVAGVGADLLIRYAEQHRSYHGLAHLQAVLQYIDELTAHAEHPDVVRLAAWFHDSVYDPRRNDNEERSAELAETLLAGLRVEPVIIDEVVRLVRLTASHRPEEGDRNGAVLCDADLAILGADDDAYAAYRDAVRAEYGHVDDASFRRGRAVVLRRLLAYHPLFTTSTACERWERAARKNMMAELAAAEA